MFNTSELHIVESDPVNFHMKFADYILYVAGDYDYNVTIADMALIVQVVLSGKILLCKIGNHILLLPQCFRNYFSRSNVKSQYCVVKGFQNPFSKSNVKSQDCVVKG